MQDVDILKIAMNIYLCCL